MCNLKIETERYREAEARVERAPEKSAALLAERKVTLAGVAPQAGGPRAWAPLIAAGLAPRPSAKGAAR